MATLAKLITNGKRKKLATKYAPTRQKLKEIIASPTASAEDKDKANRKLQSLPRNSTKVRFRNRCEVTGRPRGFLRKFRMSRIALRDFGLRGDIPGVIKSSW
ncbi:MAG: 30S ribosomal protein S14 [Myxococcales bacterium]|nr:30S ribosomal protein S14 [Myxococcales bacterium]